MSKNSAPSAHTSAYQDVKQELFRRYDRLNELWDLAEQQLIDDHVPHDVWFADCDDDSGRSSDLICIGLIRVKGKRRICVGYDHLNSPDPVSWTPVTDCSAEVRLRVIRMLPGLKKRLALARVDFVEQVDEGIRMLEEMLG